MTTVTKTFTVLITVTVDESRAERVTALKLDAQVQEALEEHFGYLSASVDSVPGDLLEPSRARDRLIFTTAVSAKGFHESLRAG